MRCGWASSLAFKEAATCILHWVGNAGRSKILTRFCQALIRFQKNVFHWEDTTLDLHARMSHDAEKYHFY
jgi:hypothetical protein